MQTKNHAYKGFLRVVAGAAALCMALALPLPASAQNLKGKVLHTHDAFCFNSAGRLLCPMEELVEHTHSERCYEVREQETTPAGHTHTDTCYTNTRGALICADADHTHTESCYTSGDATDAGHTHSSACYTKEKGNLTCTSTEYEGHAHGNGCYVSSGVLTCAVEESEEHTHSDACYGKTLACQTEESAGHAHADGCFAWEEHLTCGLEESAKDPVLTCNLHVHGDACYEWTKMLSCGMEESAAETQPAEKVLVCTRIEFQNHIHDKTCYRSALGALAGRTCGKIQLERHQHAQTCMDCSEAELICQEKAGKAHQHDYRCYDSWTYLCQNPAGTDGKKKSDPNADVETAAIWEKTFEDVKLTGAWPNDLLAIARTQLGYRESERNFVVDKDGNRKGYTRYGQWYGGVEYGDWCAMFVAFCMEYAGVEGVPVSCNCDKWTEYLEKAGMYTAEKTYVPRPGDFVFFDRGRTAETPAYEAIIPDHVGIVVEVIPATAETPAQLVTVEGNYYDCVRYETRNLDDPRITGYGLLPDGPAALYSCGLKNHAHEAACYDEAGVLCCWREEHAHEERCRCRRLRYSDGVVNVDILLSESVYLPADLHLRAALVAESADAGYDAMVAAAEEARPQQSAELRFCRMKLISQGKPYELPAGVLADVKVTFAQQTKQTDGENEALILREKVQEDGMVSYEAVTVASDAYQHEDTGMTGMRFTTERVSVFCVAADLYPRAQQDIIN